MSCQWAQKRGGLKHIEDLTEEEVWLGFKTFIVWVKTSGGKLRRQDDRNNMECSLAVSEFLDLTEDGKLYRFDFLEALRT